MFEIENCFKVKLMSSWSKMTHGGSNGPNKTGTNMKITTPHFSILGQVTNIKSIILARSRMKGERMRKNQRY